MAHASEQDPRPLIEGIDYVIETDGLFVFTRGYLLRRGTCCGNGCRNCPWQDDEELLDGPPDESPPDEMN